MAFKHAVAAGGPWEHLADACAEELDSPSATLGMIYLSPPLAADFDAIVARLTSQTGIESWAGAVGYGVCGTGIEHYDEPAISLLACDVPADSFKLLPARNGDSDGAIASWRAAQSQCLAMVHADPRVPDLAGAIGQFALDHEAFLVGALTADAASATQIAGAAPITGSAGLSGVGFGDGTSFATGLTQGCTPIGPAREITACDGDVVIELDGQSPVDLLRNELGSSFDGDWQKIAGVIFAGLIVQGSDTGDYLVRGIHGLDPQRGWLQVGGDVETGAKLVFVRRDAHSAIVDLERMLDRLVERLDGPPNAGVYYNCIGRGRSQFGPGPEELATIEDRLGTFPLVGMFGNGEISCDRLYTYTGVLTLFT